MVLRPHRYGTAGSVANAGRPAIRQRHSLGTQPKPAFASSVAITLGWRGRDSAHSLPITPPPPLPLPNQGWILKVLTGRPWFGTASDELAAWRCFKCISLLSDDVISLLSLRNSSQGWWCLFYCVFVHEEIIWKWFLLIFLLKREFSICDELYRRLMFLLHHHVRLSCGCFVQIDHLFSCERCQMKCLYCIPVQVLRLLTNSICHVNKEYLGTLLSFSYFHQWLIIQKHLHRWVDACQCHSRCSSIRLSFILS